MINQEEKEKKLKEVSDSLKGKTLDELKELEQEIIKEADKIDKEVMDYTFKLPTKNYSDAAKAIKEGDLSAAGKKYKEVYEGLAKKIEEVNQEIKDT